MMKLWFVLALGCLIATVNAQEQATSSRGELLVLQGSSGTDEYGEMFSTWASRWQSAAVLGEVSYHLISPEESSSDQKATFLTTIASVNKESNIPLWIVLIGHGTYDGRSAKINLAGPDLSAKELDEQLAKINRTIIIINCASSSAPFIEELSQKNRIVVTSTRSGEQVNFSRFGDYLSNAIADTSADLDKDRQTSLLEAFLTASRKTLEFYEADGRIPTENALLDDNGDGKGTRATAFQGVRVAAQPEEAGVLLDGFRAHQFHLVESDADKDLPPEVIAQRNEIEQKIELLRLQKKQLSEEEYYKKLEALFLELGTLVLKQSETPSKAATPRESAP